MGNLNHTDFLPVLRSRLSFQPLIRAWKETIENKNGGAAKIYSSLLEEVSQHSELLEPIDDFQLLQKHKQLIEEIATTIFPVSVTTREKLYAITDPSCYKTVFASDLIKQILPSKRENYFQGMDDEIKKNISIVKMKMAYKLILDKFYGIKLDGNLTSIYAYPDAEKGLNNYLEVELDPFFIDVSCCGERPPVPENYFAECFTVGDLVSYTDLCKRLPLDLFIFDGIVIVYVHDVTEKEAIRSIKQILKNPDFFSFAKHVEELQQEIRYLLGRQDIRVGITPFSDIRYAGFEKKGDSNSSLLKSFHGQHDKAELFKLLSNAFKNAEHDHLFFDRTKNPLKEQELFKQISNQTWNSGFIFPLRGTDGIIGSLEIFSTGSGLLNAGVLPKIEPVTELLESALHKNSDRFKNEVNKIIKEQFTPVHPAVEWKFADAAARYFFRLQDEQEPKMEPIAFADVYPMYGAIDIRNSSGQRNLSVQFDLADQLSWIKQILTSAGVSGSSFLLKETRSKVDDWSAHLNNGASTDDENRLLTFLNNDIADLLRHLPEVAPAIGSEVDKYFKAIDPDLHILNNHRKKFDDSISRINATLTRFFEREQREAQKVYPHYFERFITDGLEFNMYVGQAIAPDKKFNDIYVRNLKLWQLNAMAVAAQRICRLQPELPVPLQTTQLILVYGKPISISFRSVERRFDVDGGYNVRYEVMKKRIDKVRVKNTNERLTKPGTIAVVYTQSSEANEYMEYIDYLKKQNILTGQIEQLELEELQGVGGLKGLRVNVAFDETLDLAEKTLQNLVR